MSKSIVAAHAKRRTVSRPTDMYRSDFIQDSGTPLQWLTAWEVVAQREAAEAALRFAAWISLAALTLSIDLRFTLDQIVSALVLRVQE